MLVQLIQLTGSMLCLVPFTLAQMGRWRTDARGYILLNLVGSLLLAGSAVHERQWGFLLLEGTWFAVSTWSLLRRSSTTSLQ